MSAPTSPYLTTDEAAARLRCCRKTIQRLIGRGELPAFKGPSGRYLIREEDLPGALPPRAIPPPRPRRGELGVAAQAVQKLERGLA